VLLIHGFSGSPFELHLLGQDLQPRGDRCEAPLLAGHGASTAALGATTWRDWYQSAEAALLSFHQRIAEETGKTPRLSIIGLSMGGLLTLELCRHHAPLIRAIAVLSAPLWLPPWHLRGIRLLKRAGLSGLVLPKLFGSDVHDRALRWENPATPGMPIRALESLLDLMDHVRPGLGQVVKPALLCHGVLDHTVPYACMDAISQGLGTPREQRSTLSLPQSYHLIPLDIERATLFAAIAGHLERYLSPDDGDQ
jgi:carboxylesterase